MIRVTSQTEKELATKNAKRHENGKHLQAAARGGFGRYVDSSGPAPASSFFVCFVFFVAGSFPV
jgi:hypothetical protein